MTNHDLAIAFVPPQEWENIYDLPRALKRGTLFPALDKPFFAADACCPQPAMSNLSPEQQMMMQIQQVSFAADDLRLYLDTHEHDAQALSLLCTILQQRKELLQKFAQDYYPLTFDCMAECGCESNGCYCWTKGPAPWEGVCD